MADVVSIAPTRARILRRAARLLRRQGYQATGLKQVLEESGAPRGSFYFHFPGGKEQLAVEALRFEIERVARAIDVVLAAHAESGPALRAFLAGFGEIVRRSDFALGCPVGIVTLDSAPRSEALRAVCCEGFACWQQRLRAHLERAGLAAARADSLATLALSAAEGALMVSRARRDTRAFEAVCDEIERLVTA